MNRAVTQVSMAALLLAGCAVQVSDFAGKSCELAEDCPEPYVCVAARPGAGRTCEVLGLPGLSDGGGPAPGPVPTWCADVQPLINSYCTSNCHGAVQDGSGQTGFRLDIYESDGGLKGAREMAPRMEVRAFKVRDMPPRGNPAPSSEEREVIGRWAAGGAPFCNGGGADGGVDGGVDGGG